MITRVLMRPSSFLAALLVGSASLAMAMLVWPAAPASAHSELVESTPAAGSTLSKAATEVELVFGEGVQQQGGSIMVTVGDTIVSQNNTFTVHDNVASIQLVSGGDPGTYRVSFRVVSADGHPVQDTFAYEVKGSTPTATSAADPSATPTPSTSPLAGESDSDDSSGAVVWVLGAGAIGLALVAALIAVAMRGRRDRSS